MNKKHDLNASILFRTYKRFALWAYWFYATSTLSPSPSKKPKLLFHASREKKVHCKPNVSKRYYKYTWSFLHLHSFTSKLKFIFTADAHADRVWSLSEELWDLFPPKKGVKVLRSSNFCEQS